MIYLFETEIPNNKSIYYSLRKIYGIGKIESANICKTLGFSINLKVFNMSTEQITYLIKYIDTSNLLLNNELKKLHYNFLKTLVQIKTYRGLRRLNKLPVRGQRTRTNARTAKTRSNFT